MLSIWEMNIIYYNTCTFLLDERPPNAIDKILAHPKFGKGEWSLNPFDHYQ